MKSFYELIKQRRSIRKFAGKEVELEKIELILKAALMAPSSKKRNPWEFVLIKDRTLLRELAQCKLQGSSFLKDANSAIVVLADSTKSDVWVEDATIAATIIQLQALDLGLGSCWIQTHLRMYNESISSENYIRNQLVIPEQFQILCIIALGYPAEQKQEHDDTILQFKKIHYETF